VSSRLPERDPLDAPSSDTRRLEHDLELGKLGMRCKPGVRRRLDAPHLLRIDHLEGIAVLDPALLLHLDHDEAATPAENEIELVSANAGVGVEKSVAAKAIVAEGASLSVIHAAS
jgi:hypothetical protein